MNNNYLEKVKMKDVFVIAIPMILATISIPFLGLVDTIIAGHLGNADYLSAVEIGDTIFGFIYMLFSFLRMAVTGLAAQAAGRNAKEELFVILIQGLLLSVVLGLLIALIPKGLLGSLLDFINSDKNVYNSSFGYLNIRLFSVPAALANLVISAFLLGIRRAKFSMYLLLLINITAILLDILFTCCLGMGVNGLAFAILTGQYIGLIFGVIAILNALNAKFFELASNAHLYIMKGFARFMNINKNLLIRSACFITVYGIFLVSSSRLGILILSVNSLLLAFYSFVSLGLEGFANAAEVLVGTAVGKNNDLLLRQSIVVSLRCALIAAVGISLVYMFAGHYIINLMTDLPDVRILSIQSLMWVVILPLICVWCFLLDAIFLGFLRIKAMRNSLVIATLGFFIPVWLFTQPYGNNGLWFSLISFFIGRILVLLVDLLLEPLPKLSNALSGIK